MVNPQRLVKPLGNWGRRSLIPFDTPLPSQGEFALRVSARVLLPRFYDIIDPSRFLLSKRSSQPNTLDLKTLADQLCSKNDRRFLDDNNSFLFINFYDPVLGDEYKSSAVIFPDGALVTWYMRLDSEMQLASDLIALHKSVLPGQHVKENVEMDKSQSLEHIESLSISPSNIGRESTMIGGDSIALTGNDHNRSNEMLAVSIGLSAAVRMNVIESRLQSYIESGQSDIDASVNTLNQWRLSQLSEYVFEAEKGVHRWRYLLSSVHRTSVADALWDHEDLDRLFDSITQQFELNERYEDLQSQLSYYSDFLKTVGDYVRHGYSSRLEKIIILIIAIEAAIALRHLYLELIIPPLVLDSCRE
jgi:uncharacterized Rmd1/YagE family protein